MATPKLSTAIRARIERRDQQAQTAFPAKVTQYNASANTVTLEPQFIEAWVRRDGVRMNESGDLRLEDVPVCFPRHMSWTINGGEFGLVICTKYSLDKWRNERGRIDPGDLRRFTMAGATFHPVLMDETPQANQFAALAGKTEKEIDRIWYVLTSWTPGVTDSGAALKAAAIAERGVLSDPMLTGAVDCASTTVKVSE